MYAILGIWLVVNMEMYFKMPCKFSSPETQTKMNSLTWGAGFVQKSLQYATGLSLRCESFVPREGFIPESVSKISTTISKLSQLQIIAGVK